MEHQLKRIPKFQANKKRFIRFFMLAFVFLWTKHILRTQSKSIRGKTQLRMRFFETSAQAAPPAAGEGIQSGPASDAPGARGPVG